MAVLRDEFFTLFWIPVAFLPPFPLIFGIFCPVCFSAFFAYLYVLKCDEITLELRCYSISPNYLSQHLVEITLFSYIGIEESYVKLASCSIENMGFPWIISISIVVVIVQIN